MLRQVSRANKPRKSVLGGGSEMTKDTQTATLGEHIQGLTTPPERKRQREKQEPERKGEAVRSRRETERENRMKQHLCYEDRGGNAQTETWEAGEEGARERSRLNTARSGQARSNRTKFARHGAAGSSPPLGSGSTRRGHLCARPAPSGAGPGALPLHRSVTSPCPCRGKLSWGYSHRPT